MWVGRTQSVEGLARRLTFPHVPPLLPDKDALGSCVSEAPRKLADKSQHMSAFHMRV